MRHFASPAFWEAYESLPKAVRELADKNYALLKQNPQHPSLHLKKLGAFGPYALVCATGHLPRKLTAACCGFGLALTLIMMRSSSEES
jgi:hypothetical protein